jgi:soluble lytic murein transglycosylase-like protein
MAASQASAAGLPASLVERVIRRESGGNPRAVHAGNYGLMQIRLGTARAMGYSGSAAGLLDPQTNMTYALRYLAGAYRAAGGNESRAVALYSRGYYNQAKAQGFSPYASGATTTAGWGFGNYGASFQPALQTAARRAEQYGLRHRRHYHV